MTRSVSTALPPAHVPSGNRPDVRLPRCQAPLVKTVSRASKPKPLCVVSARHGCATNGVQGARRCRSKHLSDMDMRIPQSAAPARFLRTAVRQNTLSTQQAANCDSPAKRPRAARTDVAPEPVLTSSTRNIPAQRGRVAVWRCRTVGKRLSI